ncbi:MAG: MerR family transcriptional regulator [bacterium]|nr:MerR family transcriptional regulator [bacterium]
MAKIPSEKLYYTIREVSKLLGIKEYVLRYWETEFPTLRPLKSSSGQRKYKQKDIEKLQRIKHLLYEEQYTIAGAKRKLAEEELPPEKKQELVELLNYTKKELNAILTKLNR